MAAEHDRFHGGNREVSLTHPAGTHQQDAVFALHTGNRRIFLSETLHEHFCLAETAIPSGELIAGSVDDFVVGFVIFEITVAVAFGNAGALQGAFRAVPGSAIAGNGPNHFGFALRRSTGTVRGERLRALRVALDYFPSASLTMGTIWLRHEGRISAARGERKRRGLCIIFGGVDYFCTRI